MSPGEEWAEVTALLRGAADPLQSAHLPRFYALAERDGIKSLASYRRTLGDERIRDLIFDLLVSKLGAILAADHCRAYFLTALQRSAISWRRRGDAAVVEDAPEAPVHGATTPSDSEDARQAFRLDARELLAQLSERDREIVIAVAVGEDREAVAAAHRTSRANVDQIVSRTKQRFRAGAT